MLQVSRKLFHYLIIAAAVIFLLVFFLIPVGSVIFSGLSLKGINDVFTNPYYLRVILFTIIQAFLSTLISVVIALPGAYFLAKYNFPGKRFFKALSSIPFVLPSILVVLGFVIFFGNNGVINKFLKTVLNTENTPLQILYGFRGILLAHVFFNFPIIIRLTSKYWAGCGEHEEQAAALLGAGPVRTFFTITLPKIMPAIISAASLVFMFCFMSFTIVLVFGGSPKYTTIEVAIYNLARDDLDFSIVSNLAFVSLIFSGIIIFINILFQRRLPKQNTAKQFVSRKLYSKQYRKIIPFSIIYAVIISGLILGPLISIIIKSLTVRSGFMNNSYLSFEWYTSLFNNSSSSDLNLSAVGNSLIISLSAMFFSMSVGLLLAYLTRIKTKLTLAAESIFALPLSISSVVLGFGYLTISSKLHTTPFLTIMVIALAHTVLGYPFVMRAVSSYYKKYSNNIFYAAALCGAGPFQAFKTIDLPLLWRPLLSIGAFSFALSIGEFNTSLILSKGKISTIPVLMHRMIGAFQYNAACVYGVFLIIIALVLFWIIDKEEAIL